MIFRHKKSSSKTSNSASHMRGRDDADNGSTGPASTSDNPLARRFQVDEEPDTKDLAAAEKFRDTTIDEEVEPSTLVLAEGNENTDQDEAPALKNPVSGFLVIISGPGRGSISRLRYGMNSIGRDGSQQIALDHGDNRISREGHCTVTYDPVTRKFYLQHGEGVQLTYLDGQPVLEVMQLSAGNKIRVGETELLFVPLCGESFDWTD
jgi:hypothetical protein